MGCYSGGWSPVKLYGFILFFFFFSQNPTADDGGDYKCVVKNDLGQLQAKLNLNIEAEPAVGTPAAPAVAGAPTFTEKPKIVTQESGKLVQMIVR